MNKKILFYIAVGIIILLLVLSSFGMMGFKSRNNSGNVGSVKNADYSNLPEECRKPDSQDLQSWKEHLGHHENTKYCLEYFK